MSETLLHKKAITLDEDDYRSLMQAYQRRLGSPLPEGDSCELGACLAEICRGWEELLDFSLSQNRRAEGS